MLEPKIPDNEIERLQSLRTLNILDTEAEERFDRLTRLARNMFHVPIALVSLIDENRQWFKSSAGLDATETPRNISFCGHAILGEITFIVPDTLEDERFRDNPLVTDAPHIRFYAGHPLRDYKGNKLGTLCIIDHEPRQLSPQDAESLKDLAEMAEKELAAAQLATIDELTKISNRRGFMMLAQSSLDLCARQKLPATLAYLDLNKFKQVNDQFGHAEGDLALVVFANQMSICFRNSDVFARLAGDEFVVLLTDVSPEQAELAIERLRSMLAKYNQSAQRGYAIEFSAGVLQFLHKRLARRCATIRCMEEAILNAGTPMLIKRVSVSGALFVCNVDKTRWPVCAAFTDISAVSRSRISPTIMMSGSCRKKALNAEAKVKPTLLSTLT